MSMNLSAKLDELQRGDRQLETTVALCEIRTQLQELTKSVESCQSEVSEVKRDMVAIKVLLVSTFNEISVSLPRLRNLLIRARARLFCRSYERMKKKKKKKKRKERKNGKSKMRLITPPFKKNSFVCLFVLVRDVSFWKKFFPYERKRFKLVLTYGLVMVWQMSKSYFLMCYAARTRYGTAGERRNRGITRIRGSTRRTFTSTET